MFWCAAHILQHNCRRKKGRAVQNYGFPTLNVVLVICSTDPELIRPSDPVASYFLHSRIGGKISEGKKVWGWYFCECPCKGKVATQACHSLSIIPSATYRRPLEVRQNVCDRSHNGGGGIYLCQRVSFS